MRVVGQERMMYLSSENASQTRDGTGLDSFKIGERNRQMTRTGGDDDALSRYALWLLIPCTVFPSLALHWDEQAPG